MPDGYIRLLDQLYHGQQGKVHTDKLSKPFAIARGTKQGDPLSSLLFNAVLEDIMRDVKPAWIRRNIGLELGNVLLSELRFADDLLLLATSTPAMRSMLGDVVAAPKRRGLELHPDKTKILCNKSVRSGRISRPYLDVGDMRVEVLPYVG